MIPALHTLHIKVRLALLTGFVCLGACTASPPLPPRESVENQAVLSCSQYYIDLTGIIDKHRVTDAQSSPVRDFPYLHVNRFLADLRARIDNPDKLKLWLELTAQLALQTNTIEINNLPNSAQQQLADITPLQWQNFTPVQVLERCSQTLWQYDVTSPTRQRHITGNANVPDDYRTWQRVVGLYPLVAFPVAAGIRNWHQRSTTALHTATAELPVRGALLRYTPDIRLAYNNIEEVNTAIRAAKQNAFKIPLPDEKTRQRLFATFAPIWEVDTVKIDDKIGAPFWPPGATYAAIDTTRPSIYTLVSHVYLNTEILLQLNYVVWFPSRPCTSSLDVLCGHMDGITWRVTLGADGTPLLYDTIHNCGCYHTFFPGKTLRPIPPPPITVESRPSLDETAFSPIQAPRVNPPQPLLLRIAATSHHIESVYANDRAHKSSGIDEVSMSWDNYHTLRSLPYGNPQNDRHHKSLFEQNALVAGSQRKERWFFWPLGVPSAGAMRQWGNHATAFIGRRHFDEPHLIDNYFTLTNP